MLSINRFDSYEQLNTIYKKQQIIDFLYVHLGQFGDSKDAIGKCMDYAFSELGGFLLTAEMDNNLVGVLIINNTNMKDYIPEHILVYVAVDSDYRGNGIGKQIVERALKECNGNVKLHVEYENPAKRLYERIGFTSKYAEMRFTKEK